MKRKNLSHQNLTTYQHIKKNSSKIDPQLKRAKPLEIGGRIKKLIHYDCKETEDLNEEVPDEEEVYVRENLLRKNKEDREEAEEGEDELGMVNVNVSVLVSEDGEDKPEEESEGREVDKIGKLDELIENSRNNNKTEEQVLRKKFCKTQINGRCVIQEENEEEGNDLFDIEDDENNDKPQINVFNININHKAENVVSEKKILKSQRKADDMMVRDIKSLHLITKKALLNLTKKTNDKIETKEKSGFHNFKSNSLNLFVSDHSDYPVGHTKQNRQKIISKRKSKEEKVINIINFNNNYTIGTIVLENSNKSDKNQWRSPLDSSALQQIFKSSTPKYNKNFIFNKTFSLISVHNSNEKEKRLSEIGGSKTTKKTKTTINIQKIIQTCKENKSKQVTKNFVKFQNKFN